MPEKMSSLITNPIHCCVTQKPIFLINSPSNPLFSIFKNRVEFARKPTVSISVEERAVAGLVKMGQEKFQGSPLCCRCAGRCESEGDIDLEEQILEFMDNSSEKVKFPSKKDLLKAGRLDIVEAMKKKGGWFLLGWDSEDEGDTITMDKTSRMQSDVEDLQMRAESYKESSSSVPFSSKCSSPRISSISASSTSNLTSLGDQIECDSGIEGILSRLEKERNLSFGVNLGKPGNETHVSRHYTAGDILTGDSGDQGTLTLGSTKEGPVSSLNNNNRHYTQPDQWQSWSRQRAGFNGMDFEAAEIPYMENGYLQDNIIGTAEDTSNVFYGRKASYPSSIQTRLHDLETELASAFHTLRPSTVESNTKKVLDSSSSDNLEALSDAMEFQENEYISAQQRLRAIRATLSVLEGKMALAIMDTQKILNQKQTRIDKASRMRQMLRSTCIFWHSFANEVFLAGSFDGWTTKRKMEKSRSGTFKVCLKLYPGKYEIKFIVDGIWKTDPLQPIVNNNGYENNVLTIV